METVSIKARAKINLTLDVLGRRPDGYHDLRSVMQSVTLCDDIEIITGTGEKASVARSNLGYIPQDDRNIALRAARRFFEESRLGHGGLEVRIVKRIPVCAGLGGGSADAAAVLEGLNARCGRPISRDRLVALALELGADVPFCLMGGTALAEGVGERLTPLPPMPSCHIVICKPPASVRTAKAFELLSSSRQNGKPDLTGMLSALERGDLGGVARRVFNVFEPVLGVRYRDIPQIRSVMIDCGALGAAMSGSGSATFGVFSDEGGARRAAARLSENFDDVFMVMPC